MAMWIEARGWKLVPIIDDRRFGAEICAHCGGQALGYASLDWGIGPRVRVCHDDTRSCYEAITVWGEKLGHPKKRMS